MEYDETEIWIGQISDAPVEVPSTFCRQSTEPLPEDTVFIGVTMHYTDGNNTGFLVSVQEVRQFINTIKKFERNGPVGYDFMETPTELSKNICFMCGNDVDSSDEKFVYFPQYDEPTPCLHQKCINNFVDKIFELIENSDDVFSKVL